MRSLLLRRVSPRCGGAVCMPSAAFAPCVLTPHRTILVRDLCTPVTVERGDDGVAPYPAQLLWRFNSLRPTHLVLCLRRPPPPAAAPPVPVDAFEDLDVTETPTDVEGGGVARRAEDYMYGRLFLRPYNVAQLLTVLQGWSDAPAVVERERSSLTLSAAPLSSPSAVARPAREALLTVRLTRKSFAAATANRPHTAAAAAAEPLTDTDLSAEEDFRDSVYVDAKMDTMRVELRDADLVLLTTHLESVLGDLFGVQHSCFKREQRPSSRGSPHRAGHVSTGDPARPSEERPRPRPRYGSERYTQAVGSREAARVAAPPPPPPPPRTPQTGQGGDGQGQRHSDRRQSAAAAAVPVSASSANVTAAPVDGAETAAAEDDQADVLEEVIIEEVEEEEVEDGDKDTTGSAVESAAAPSAPAVATSATSQVVSQTHERGEATMESADRYAEASFARDGSAAAAEVREVRRIGDVDVMRSTRNAESTTEAQDGSRTTVHATTTTGAFRSTGGEVTGTFSYERLSTSTEQLSDAAAASAAAVVVAAVEGAGATRSEKHAEGEEEEVVVADAAAAQPRKRQSRSNSKSGTAAASKKKKSSKKKSTKTPAKRKTAAASAATAAETVDL
ncbi:hypothetical protein NESM_000766800 [Novymonas esmeraldas]|uniref:Uncharacterized protein n=1 Tax=Novymonas esmeraldas TaxID=1808958 RepID=A0AAW0EZ05_9TRYP